MLFKVLLVVTAVAIHFTLTYWDCECGRQFLSEAFATSIHQVVGKKQGHPDAGWVF